MKRGKKIVLWVAVAVVIILGLAAIYGALFVGLVKVPTGAMKNTIIPGDRIAVDRLYREVRRGDVIVFKYPRDPSTRFVSRVIGLPGETIQVKAGRVYINGQELSEQHCKVAPELDVESVAPLRVRSTEGTGSHRVYEYGQDDRETFPPMFEGIAVKQSFLIPHNEYFVMGDNRDNSLDSRFWGTVKREFITGKCWFVYWSVGSDGSRPERVFKRVR